jgi:hypothetical protein
LDSFDVDLFDAIEHLSGTQYEFEMWNIHDHSGIDSSVLDQGWSTIMVTGMKCDHTLPGRDLEADCFVRWLEKGTFDNPHSLLYIDQDYFSAHLEYGSEWDGELGHGDFLYDYFGVAYARSDESAIHPYTRDSVATGVDDFEGIRVCFSPDAMKPRYPMSWVRSDYITETTQDAEEIFLYLDHPQYGAGVRLDRGHYRTVYLPWQDFFAVDSTSKGDLIPREGLTQTIEKILEWFGTKTSLDIESQVSPGPQGHCLCQNYPNPFNPTTTVQFAVGSGQSKHRTTLKIFNVLGQEVRMLVDEVQREGSYTVIWDGKDRSGIDVSSGVYFCRLQTGIISESRRMVLLR